MSRAAPVLSTVMNGGLIALVAVLVVATAAGLLLRRRSGRFRTVAPRPAGESAAESDAPIGESAERLTATDLGTDLGERATLVQFSTAFCAPCRPTRQVLTRVAQMVDGVAHVDIDAAARLDLVRRLRVNSAPTVFVLGPDGGIVKRATGQPREADVLAALGQVMERQLAQARIARGSDSRSESE
jgi:thiol-disulfide isomerase/thioredoxin